MPTLMPDRRTTTLTLTPTTTEEDSNNNCCYPVATADYTQISEDASRFFDSLRSFHDSFGTLFSVPTIGGKPLDLHKLFLEVTSRGGLEKVIRDRRWKEVIMLFNFPPTITSASFVLRKHYLSLLYHFERVYYFRKQAPPCAASESQTPQLGCPVSGTVDGKFDNGYLVTVQLDSGKLMGVLYHVPRLGYMPQSSNSNTSIVRRRRCRKRTRMDSQDPKSDYNFFHSEQYARLKAFNSGQDKKAKQEDRTAFNKLAGTSRDTRLKDGVLLVKYLDGNLLGV